MARDTITSPRIISRHITADDARTASGIWTTSPGPLPLKPSQIPSLWWRLPGEEVWPGVRAPLGELTCDQGSHGLEEDREDRPANEGTFQSTWHKPKRRLMCISRTFLGFQRDAVLGLPTGRSGLWNGPRNTPPEYAPRAHRV